MANQPEVIYNTGMIETYSANPFAREVYGAMKGAGFGEDFHIIPVVDESTIEQIKGSKLQGLDYRAKINPEPGFASTFEGLAFDPDHIRTQSTAIFDKDKPIGLMTHVIAPRKWIEQQRYFERVDGGIRVRDFKAVSNNGIADFMVIPGWTILDSDYRFPRKIIRPGFTAFNKIMEMIQASAPKNTYVEAVAMGRYPASERQKLLDIAARDLDTFVPLEELPFELDMIGLNADGSMASVYMAERMGLKRVAGLGASRSLGPVFVKQL